AAAIAVGETLAGRPLGAEDVNAAIRRVGVGEEGRLAPIELADGTVVIDDTYNANPGSVLASAAAAAEIASVRGARLVLVLGEMRELGPDSETYHRDVADRVLAH